LLKLKGVKKVEVAGSFRRGKETVGDLDILVIGGAGVISEFVKMPGVQKVIAKGPTKGSVQLSGGLQVDLRVVGEKEFGSALLYFTGNKQHNISLRKLAIKKGYKLSEYGLFKGKKWLCGKTEEEIYHKLGMQYIEPEMRTNNGEIDLALAKKLPKLIELKDVRGDFQMHSTWSDGANLIKEMAAGAAKKGYKIIALTDHIGDMGVVNSLKGRRFEQYLKEIAKVNQNSKVRVLKGAEIDIDKQGKLKATPSMLEKLEIVLGSVHMGFKGSTREQTKRLCAAMRTINIWGHPTARRIGRREALSLDMEKVFAAAKENHVFLEINGSIDRMDLKTEHIWTAKKMGCKFSLGSDAHSVANLDWLKYAVILARRGGLEKKDILNCWDWKKIKKSIKK